MLAKERRCKIRSSCYNMTMGKKNKKEKNIESDSVYFLKIVLYLVMGSMWLKVTKGDTSQIPIPLGFILGMAFATHEHFQTDKKIELAILLIAMLVGFWAPFGIYIML